MHCPAYSVATTEMTKSFPLSRCYLFAFAQLGNFTFPRSRWLSDQILRNVERVFELLCVRVPLPPSILGRESPNIQTQWPLIFDKLNSSILHCYNYWDNFKCNSCWKTIRSQYSTHCLARVHSLLASLQTICLHFCFVALQNENSYTYFCTTTCVPAGFSWFVFVLLSINTTWLISSSI